MTKIAVSSEGPGLGQAVDPRFGRAAGFMIVDPKEMSYHYVDNVASQTMVQGAGIQAAEILVRSGAKVVLTGYVGPKAFHALQTAGIQIAQNLDQMSVGEAVHAYIDGCVEIIQASNGGRQNR
ncbi:MAG: NifB/NifX family molybdenum-iron cluster-binding protein [Desulfosarcinaceae bacterium]|nr:NifB/NifX family molybdenum-iron cluster-binding protein [Desulfosarcinaceae bacterium]